MEPIDLKPENVIFRRSHAWTLEDRIGVTFEAIYKVGNTTHKIMDLTKRGIFTSAIFNANYGGTFNPNANRAALSKINLNEKSKMVIENINSVTKQAFIKFLNDNSSDEVKANLKKDLPVGDEFFKYMDKTDYETIIKFVELCKKQNVDLSNVIKGNDIIDKSGYLNYMFYFGKNTIIADREHNPISLESLVNKKPTASMKVSLPVFSISYKDNELPKSVNATYVVDTLTVQSIGELKKKSTN